jgi:WD40 repeat protein/serine/threonine protein kinase
MNAILLKQRYRILDHLGQGGMGTVYRAEDTQLGNRAVAIKEFLPAGQTQQEDAAAAASFQREALMLAHLSHPNLPSIHDHFGEAGRWYLVMDYIPGPTLEERLQQTGGQGLGVEEVIRIGQQLCDVLEYLHNRQPPIIFRDLKPSNIILAPGGGVYVIDFGIARFFRPGQHGDTQHLGTEGYAAPEQYSNARQTTTRTDLYGLGATLHHALTGIDPSRQPFVFAPLRSRCPQAPPMLDRLIARLVATDESHRPASATEVRADLERVAAILRIAAPAVRPGHTTPLPTQPSPWHTLPLLPPSPPRRAAAASSATPPAIRSHSGWPSARAAAATALPAAKPRRPLHLDLATLVLAGLLMALTFGLCVWVPYWLSHAFADLIASPPVAPVAHHASRVYTYREQGGGVAVVAWSQDGQRIASGSRDGTLQVWDALTGDHAATYQGPGVAISALAWSPDGQWLASAGSDGLVHVWDTATGNGLFTYNARSAVTALAWSPNGRWLAVGAQDTTVRVWNPATAATLSIYRGHSGAVNALAWATDNRRIVSGSSDGTARVWDAVTGRSLVTYAGHSSAVWAVAWSRDGSYVASGAADGTLQVWDAATAQRLAGYHAGPSRAIVAVAWSPDSERIAYAERDAWRIWAWQEGSSSAAYAIASNGTAVWALRWVTDGRAAAAAVNPDGMVRVWPPA